MTHTGPEFNRFDESSYRGEKTPGSEADGNKIGLTPEQIIKQQKEGEQKPSDDKLVGKGAEQAHHASEVARGNVSKELSQKPNGYSPEELMAWGVPDKPGVPKDTIDTMSESLSQNPAV